MSDPPSGDSQIATVVNTTITGNVSRKPYGAISIADELALRNSLVIGNAGGDTSGLTAQVASIVGIPAGLTLADILDPDGLQDNGGPTETIALTDFGLESGAPKTATPRHAPRPRSTAWTNAACRARHRVTSAPTSSSPRGTGGLLRPFGDAAAVASVV